MSAARRIPQRFINLFRSPSARRPDSPQGAAVQAPQGAPRDLNAEELTFYVWETVHRKVAGQPYNLPFPLTRISKARYENMVEALERSWRRFGPPPRPPPPAPRAPPSSPNGALKRSRKGKLRRKGTRRR